MAYDKVVDSAALDAAMTYTANRIRTKTGGTDQIAWDSAKGFGDAVEAIPTGGGDPLAGLSELETFNVSPATTVTDFVADIPNVASLAKSFYGTRLTPIQKIELTVSTKLTNVSWMFGNGSVGSLTEIVFKGDFSKVTSLRQAFSCSGSGRSTTLKKSLG